MIFLSLCSFLVFFNTFIEIQTSRIHTVQRCHFHYPELHTNPYSQLQRVFIPQKEGDSESPPISSQAPEIISVLPVSANLSVVCMLREQNPGGLSLRMMFARCICVVACTNAPSLCLAEWYSLTVGGSHCVYPSICWQTFWIVSTWGPLWTTPQGTFVCSVCVDLGFLCPWAWAWVQAGWVMVVFGLTSGGITPPFPPAQHEGAAIFPVSSPMHVVSV